MSTMNPELDKRIQQAFIHHPHVNSRKLHIRTDSNRVILTGEVKSFYEKQMAQEALRQIDGISVIENQLDVNWNPHPLEPPAN